MKGFVVHFNSILETFHTCYVFSIFFFFKSKEALKEEFGFSIHTCAVRVSELFGVLASGSWNFFRLFPPPQLACPNLQHLVLAFAAPALPPWALRPSFSCVSGFPDWQATLESHFQNDLCLLQQSTALGLTSGFMPWSTPFPCLTFSPEPFGLRLGTPNQLPVRGGGWTLTQNKTCWCFFKNPTSPSDSSIYLLSS